MRISNNMGNVHEDLRVLLANTYVVYVKAQKFHWNVEDRYFFSLHAFFEKIYESLSEAVDDIAERLRTLGYPAPGSFKEFLELTTLSEAVQSSYKADEMLEILARDYASICDFLKQAIQHAGEVGDVGTEDFFTERLREHEKDLWMIRAHIQK